MGRCHVGSNAARCLTSSPLSFGCGRFRPVPPLWCAIQQKCTKIDIDRAWSINACGTDVRAQTEKNIILKLKQLIVLESDE